MRPLEVLAVILHFGYGYRITDVAEWLDLPLSEARVLLYRGASKIKMRGLPK